MYFILILNTGNPLIDIQLLIFILNIGSGNIGVDVAVHYRFIRILFPALAL